MKKKYLFLFVLLPLLSFGQDTTYAIQNGKLIETITHDVGSVVSPEGRNYTGKLTYKIEKSNVLVIETLSKYGDKMWGFLCLHDRTYRDTYRFDRSGMVLISSELLSDKCSILGCAGLWGIMLVIFIFGFAFDNKETLTDTWLDSRRYKRFPRFSVYSRVLVFALLYAVVYFFCRIYGGNVIFPVTIVTVLLFISIIALIRRCRVMLQERRLQLG